MGNLFYLLGILVFLTLLSNLINLNKYYSIRYWINSFKKVTGKEPRSEDFRQKSDYDVYLVYSAFSILQFFWYLIGITSGSWPVFSILILANFLILRITYSLPQTFVGKTILHLHLLLKVVVVIALIMNHFHFHYDWSLLFK